MNEFKTAIVMALVMIGAVLVLWGIPYAIYSYSTKDTLENVCIKDKERIGGDYGQYLIFAETEVLQNSDNLWNLKFNSSDIYSEIEKGSCYDMEVYGWRVPFLSLYKNILKITKTSETLNS